MKASPFSYLTFSSLLIALSISVAAQSGQYTVQVDSMTAQDAAEGKVHTLKSQGQQAYWLKSTVPGQGLRYRVRIGRFPSRVAAQTFGARLKQQGLTSDFFVALYEGASSPLGEPVKKPTPPPVLSAAPKSAPAETKTAAIKTATPTAQRQRETKPLSPPAPAQSSVPANSTTEKTINNAPAAGNVAKPIAAPQIIAPTTTTPSNTPKPMAPAPTETKPLQSKPLNATPLDEVKPPRDKKADNVAPNNASTPTAVSSAASTVAAVMKTETSVGKESPAAKPIEIMAAVPPAPTSPTEAFARFEERGFGYSFEHPNYWNGGRLNSDELQAQRIDAGAVFRSQEDVAFMNAIWNSLKNANSPAYDNNLIVDLVIKSLSSGTGLQGLSEVSRRMVQEGDQIKTFVDLRTLFRQPRANSPLEFQGKAVIIRANTGILLVVSFYSKDSAPAMAPAAERIISSARVP